MQQEEFEGKPKRDWNRRNSKKRHSNNKGRFDDGAGDGKNQGRATRHRLDWEDDDEAFERDYRIH